MVGKLSFALLTLTILPFCLVPVYTNPAIATGYEPLEICMENCALCRKMLGTWFNGQLCGESCYKYRGKLIPEYLTGEGKHPEKTCISWKKFEGMYQFAMQQRGGLNSKPFTYLKMPLTCSRTLYRLS